MGQIGASLRRRALAYVSHNFLAVVSASGMGEPDATQLSFSGERSLVINCRGLPWPTSPFVIASAVFLLNHVPIS